MEGASMNDEVGSMPEPKSEEPELIPGGTDALERDSEDDGLARDLDPEANPAVDDVLPEEIAEPDEKSQAPDGEADDAEESADSDDASGDSPGAGQKSEDGSVEPPA